jgi:hypothetical protein
MKTITMSVCASVRPNIARETIFKKAAEVISMFFAITLPVGVQF